MKIYFAGDMTEGDWRYSFMRPEHLMFTADHIKSLPPHSPCQWPVMRRAVFNAIDYVGPFHEEKSDDVRGYLAALESQEQNNHFLQGVDEADCVFVYVSPDLPFDRAALQTGYAIARGKPILVACAEGGWEKHEVVRPIIAIFAYDFVLHSENPGEDLRQMLLKSGFFFQSPLEKTFWQAATCLYPSLTPQFPIGPYYADFALPEDKLAIEIDGQEFHASKEQRTRDAKRDRFFMEQGWRVARFTGTEIFKDVHKCVKDVLRLVVEGRK